MPRWVYGTGAAVIVVVVLFALMGTGGSTDAAVSGVARVERGNMEVTVTGPGSVRAANSVEVEVPYSVDGELQLIYLYPEGRVVQAGEIVAQLDTTSAVEDLETEIEELETAEASYEQALEDLANNIKNLENAVRSRQLSYDQAVLQRQNLEFSSELEQQQGDLDVENARISLNEAERQLEAQKIINETDRRRQEISLQSQREDLEEARRDLAALTIRAPISGMVIHGEQGRWMERTKVKEGDTVRRGQELIELPDLSELLVEIRINELDNERVATGQRAIVHLEAYPHLELPGHVVDVSTLAQQTSDGGNVKVFPTVIMLDSADERARPGMTASVDIIVEEFDDVVLAPLSAIGLVDGREYVKPVRSDEPVRVELGLRNESMVEIVSGLEQGTLLELGWLQDPCEVLSRMAGRNDLPEEVAWEIMVQGEEYGEESETAETGSGVAESGGSERIMSMSGARGGFDMSQITPEMMARMQQAGRGGDRSSRSAATEGRTATDERQVTGDTRTGERTGRQGGGFGGGARLGQMTEQLRQLREGLPAELQEEVDTLLAADQIDFRSLSTALRDSLRTFGRRAAEAAGRDFGARPPGMGMRRAPVDTARVARVRAILGDRVEALEGEVRTELERFIERGGVGLTRLSPALRDSFRAWKIFGEAVQHRLNGNPGSLLNPGSGPGGGA